MFEVKEQSRGLKLHKAVPLPPSLVMFLQVGSCAH